MVVRAEGPGIDPDKDVEAVPARTGDPKELRRSTSEADTSRLEAEFRVRHLWHVGLS